ncbi:hypothetical protein ZWY2020_024449 [Hordeum vulgare]|nr:hypothetical protein ZWY2020_024449 [Hordeum vulgare]
MHRQLPDADAPSLAGHTHMPARAAGWGDGDPCARLDRRTARRSGLEPGNHKPNRGSKGLQFLFAVGPGERTSVPIPWLCDATVAAPPIGGFSVLHTEC